MKRFSQNSADWGGLVNQTHFPTFWDWHLTLSLLFIFFLIGCFINKAFLAVNGHGCDFEVTEQSLEEKRKKPRTPGPGICIFSYHFLLPGKGGNTIKEGKVEEVTKSTNSQWTHNGYLEKTIFFSFWLFSHTLEKSMNI